MPLHIGIVGCSAEGAALCYRTICTEAADLLGGAHRHPEVSLHTPSLHLYVDRLDAGDLAGVAELMLASARKLAGCGADFLICPDNTIHQALALVQARSPLPWLHIADVAAAEAKRRGFRRVAITGTKWLVDSEVYPEQFQAHGLEFARPRDEERLEIDRIIMRELVCGVRGTDQVERFARIVQRMRDDEHCDAVVLGCTELPLVIDDGNSPLPTLDSTRLLARAALKRAISP
jgi:aspartate racemase